MELIEIQRPDADRLAPLVAAFRVTLDGYRGIASQPRVEAAREEIMEFLNAGFPVFAAEDGGELIGYTVCRIDEPCLWVEHLFVRDDYRRRGIATKMAVFCMRALQDAGINKITLIAFSENEGGNAFWRKIGWTSRSDDVNYYEFVLNENNITKFVQGE